MNLQKGTFSHINFRENLFSHVLVISPLDLHARDLIEVIANLMPDPVDQVLGRYYLDGNERSTSYSRRVMAQMRTIIKCKKIKAIEEKLKTKDESVGAEKQRLRKLLQFHL